MNNVDSNKNNYTTYATQNYFLNFLFSSNLNQKNAKKNETEWILNDDLCNKQNIIK